MFHVCDKECSRYTQQDHPIKGRWKVGRWEFSRCPKVYISKHIYHWINHYILYPNMPNDGGILQQTYKYYEMMVLMKDLELVGL